MKLQKIALAVALVSAPLSAFAGGSLDLFYVDQELDIGAPASVKDDGDGIGVRGAAELGNGLSFTGLYQKSDLDDRAIAGINNIEETRIGLSYDHSLDGFTVGGGLEAVSVDLDGLGPFSIALSGYSANVHASVTPIDNLSLYAHIGYTDLNKADGIEYGVGASYAVTPEVSGFVEYRIARLDGDLGNIVPAGTDVDLDTLRVGARYTFK
jgi:opacity protein-like surface antigen